MAVLKCAMMRTNVSQGITTAICTPSAITDAADLNARVHSATAVMAFRHVATVTSATLIHVEQTRNVWKNVRSMSVFASPATNPPMTILEVECSTASALIVAKMSTVQLALHVMTLTACAIAKMDTSRTSLDTVSN